jgi:hypothetical protein
VLRRGRSTLVVCKSAGSCVCWRGRSSDELEFRPHTYIPHLLILQTPTEQTHQDEMTRSSSTAHPYKHAKPTKQSNPTIRASSVEYHYPQAKRPSILFLFRLLLESMKYTFPQIRSTFPLHFPLLYQWFLRVAYGIPITSFVCFWF